MNPLLAQLAIGALALVSAAVPILAVACLMLGRPMPEKSHE